MVISMDHETTGSVPKEKKKRAWAMCMATCFTLMTVLRGVISSLLQSAMLKVASDTTPNFQNLVGGAIYGTLLWVNSRSEGPQKGWSACNIMRPQAKCCTAESMSSRPIKIKSCMVTVPSRTPQNLVTVVIYL